MKFAQVILTLALASLAYGSKCELGVRGHLTNKHPPVVFTIDKGVWKLAPPSIRDQYNTYINLSGKTVGLACPGQNNELLVNSKSYGPSASGSCSEDGENIKFVLNGDVIDTAQNIRCKQEIAGYEVITGKSCNRDGTEIKLGFMVNNVMHDLINVCHKLKDGTTYYSSHVIQGQHFPIRGFQDKGGERPTFNSFNKNIFKGFPAYRAYQERNQKRILEEASVGNLYNKKEDQFFSKGHLAPNADFVLDTWRDITFLFVNTQPQWQMINGGNWNEIEKASRNFASKKGVEVAVVTGTAGVLKTGGQPLYLGAQHTHPVPETFWKIIQDKTSKNCIGFVSNNFPINAEPTPKCKNICEQYGWPKLKNTLKEGHIYCCSYTEMKAVFPNVPAINCAGILHR